MTAPASSSNNCIPQGRRLAPPFPNRTAPDFLGPHQGRPSGQNPEGKWAGSPGFSGSTVRKDPPDPRALSVRTPCVRLQLYYGPVISDKAPFLSSWSFSLVCAALRPSNSLVCGGWGWLSHLFPFFFGLMPLFSESPFFFHKWIS